MASFTLLIALASACVLSASAFYVPGVHPMDYGMNDSVPLKVGSLISLKSELPYKYYDLPFCKPSKIVSTGANIGEVLAGDLLYNAEYDIRVGNDIACQELCTVKDFNKTGKNGVSFKLFKNLVEDQYRATLRLDNMPAIEALKGLDPSLEWQAYTMIGYPIGIMEGKELYVTNHVTFIVHYHPRKISKYEAYVAGTENEGEVVNRVVGLFVSAHSSANVCELPPKTPQKAEGDVTFTYSVQWKQSEQKWANRWDPLLRMAPQDVQTHWFSLANSLGVTTFITLVVAMLMLRILRQDIARYKQLEDLILTDSADEAAYEDYGWKVVSGDVFRRPQMYEVLCVLVGAGWQLTLVASVVLFMALFGFFSAARRGAFATWAILLYLFLAYFGGYEAARLHRRFSQSGSLTIAAQVALVVPGLGLGLWLFVDLFLWGIHSAAAVPFTTVLSLLSMWLLVMLPMAMMGGYTAGKQASEAAPVHTNQIPRGIPEQTFYYHPVVQCALAGVVPFAVCFVQLFFVMSRLYLHQFVYMWGFVFPVFLITAVAAAEAAIITIYLNLRNENYRWWWISFVAPASSGAYVFVFLASYFLASFPEVSATFTHIVVQLSHLLMLSAAIALMTGTIGFKACLWFITKIYSASKPE